MGIPVPAVPGSTPPRRYPDDAPVDVQGWGCAMRTFDSANHHLLHLEIRMYRSTIVPGSRGASAALGVSRASPASGALGAALLGGLGLWIAIGSLRTGGDPTPHLELLGATALAYLVASGLSRVHLLAVPLLIVISAGAFALLRLDVLLGGPFRAPLGYSNAAGSLFLLAAAASLVIAAQVRGRAARAASALLASAFALIPILNETRSAALMLPLLALGLLARGRTGVRLAAGMGFLATVGVLSAVSLLGLTYAGGVGRTPVHEILRPALGELRYMLWSDAVVSIARYPLFGVGPGGFAEASPTVASNGDYPWAHNEYLHLGAETGIPAVLLMLALLGWAFARIGERGEGRRGALAALALGAVCVHASVDLVLHFPAVTIAAAALAAMGAVDA